MDAKEYLDRKWAEWKRHHSKPAREERLEAWTAIVNSAVEKYGRDDTNEALRKLIN